jgi:hypothetical protein
MQAPLLYIVRLNSSERTFPSTIFFKSDAIVSILLSAIFDLLHPFFILEIYPTPFPRIPLMIWVRGKNQGYFSPPFGLSALVRVRARGFLAISIGGLEAI